MTPKGEIQRYWKCSCGQMMPWREGDTESSIPMHNGSDGPHGFPENTQAKGAQSR